MTPNQRLALKKLRTLPLTHNAARRFADESGVTVFTSLEEDYCAIKILCKTLIFVIIWKKILHKPSKMPLKSGPKSGTPKKAFPKTLRLLSLT